MRTTILIAVILLTSCAVGPNFKSPEISVPDHFRSVADSSQTGDLSRWWMRFGDERLNVLEERAIAGNINLASAIKSIEIARLNAATARATALPSIGLSASAGAKYNYDTKIAQSYSVTPTISWDIDLWGKLKRGAEAAGANFTATEYETAAVLQTLTADVAVTYFDALAYQEALAIARDTYTSRSRSTLLMDSMYYYGSISEVDLAQSRASLATAGAAVEQYQRALEQSLLALNLLMGENPTPIELGVLSASTPQIPAGLPSSLLERRPDVQQAYYGVKQANAMIGVAIANRLPSISITADGGLATSIVMDVATSRPLAWSGAAGVIAPILNWGTLKRAEKVARIQTEQALLAYEQSVIGAINEVEQALVAVSTYERELGESIKMVTSSAKAADLTAALYQSGSSSYLDLLDADRTLLSARMQYVQTVNSLISSHVTLCKALGGGW